MFPSVGSMLRVPGSISGFSFSFWSFAQDLFFHVSIRDGGWGKLSSTILNMVLFEEDSPSNILGERDLHKKVKVSYLTSVTKQANTARLNGPAVRKSPIVGDRTCNLSLRKRYVPDLHGSFCSLSTETVGGTASNGIYSSEFHAWTSGDTRKRVEPEMRSSRKNWLDMRWS